MFPTVATPDEPLHKNKASGGARLNESCFAGIKIPLLVSKEWVHFRQIPG